MANQLSKSQVEVKGQSNEYIIRKRDTSAGISAVDDRIEKKKQTFSPSSKIRSIINLSIPFDDRLLLWHAHIYTQCVSVISQHAIYIPFFFHLKKKFK